MQKWLDKLSYKDYCNLKNVYFNLRHRCLYGSRSAKEERYKGLSFWPTLEEFLDDMGPTYKPGLTIDRIDNSKGYSKENCRWATKQQQQINKTTTKPFLAVNLITLDCYICNSANAFAESQNIYSCEISRIINGKFRTMTDIPKHKNWTFFSIPNDLTEKNKPYFYIGKAFLSPGTYLKMVEYQRELGYADNLTTIREQMNHLQFNCLHLIMEVDELLRELPIKNWRPIKKQQCNDDKAQLEFIDILFFTINIAITLGWTYPELILAFYIKSTTNYKRLKEGYNK